jgi:hypothetical protein
MKEGAANWIDDMLGVAQASDLVREMVPIRVGFESPHARFCVDFAIGQECDWTAAECQISATDEAFTQLVRGEETLQSLFIGGKVALMGDPERLLRLAIVFDECSSAL